MKTISGAEFHKLENGPCGKFPHSGPVNFEIGLLPYGAALKGDLLKRADGKSRLFKTPEAAKQAVENAAAGTADELGDFNYPGSRHHY